MHCTKLPSGNYCLTIKSDPLVLYTAVPIYVPVSLILHVLDTPLLEPLPNPNRGWHADGAPPTLRHPL
ncbi:hypothetical protein BDZ91DRAFT_736601 [Kalaharituber pfeilii]|nr:hypothetical protein BDZ91DRAFT_736601 [Kalaharituber pfeilii]